MLVRLTKLAFPALAAIMLMGCSTIKFAYDNVDWVLLNKADHYLDLTDSQRHSPSNWWQRAWECITAKSCPSMSPP